MDMVTTALQYKASTYSQNDGITMVALAGYEQNETQNIPNIPPERRLPVKYPPSNYSRIYCERYPESMRKSL